MLVSLTIISLLTCPLTLGSFANQTKVRDLRSYEKAGPFSIALNLDAQSRIKIEAEVREFVWEHWRERRLGYVTFTSSAKKENQVRLISLWNLMRKAFGVWRLK